MVAVGRCGEVGKSLCMGSIIRAKSVLRWVCGGFGYGCEAFFVSCPDVLVKPGPRCVAGRTNALETCFVSALINGASLGDGVLGTGCVCAENDFCPPIDMTVCE